MPNRAARCLSVISLLVLVAGAGDALAQRGQGRDRGAQQRQEQPRSHHQNRALSAAVRRVERRTGGEVLSAERVPYEGRSLNRIKVVDSTGRVRIYMDDPRTAGRDGRSPPPRGRQRTRGDDN